jgi:hypothetical protein
MDLVEMGMPEGVRVRVVANEPCPPIPPGPGCVVQSTISHLNPDLRELTLQDEQGRRETIRPTALHRFYSGDREHWVRTEELHEGERLRGHSGWLTLIRSTRVPGVHRVYNMTVAGEHVFHVSSLGLLSHNTNACGKSVPRDWPSARKQYWEDLAEAEAKNPSGRFSKRNLAEMSEGRAPKMRVEMKNRKTGVTEVRDIAMELHHRALPQRMQSNIQNEAWNLAIVNRWAHEAMDEYRHAGWDLIKILNGTNSW